MMKNSQVVGLAFLLLVGCSTMPADEVTDSEERLVCSREDKIGSILPRMICRSPAEAERDRQDVQTWDQRRLRPNAPAGQDF